MGRTNICETLSVGAGFGIVTSMKSDSTPLLRVLGEVELYVEVEVEEGIEADDIHNIYRIHNIHTDRGTGSFWPRNLPWMNSRPKLGSVDLFSASLA